ncbi:hypothetical protein M3223_05155 [Paenibacillus pasadenensis]|nr:hypothetical protein [Paenibacillus pasadenensis]MCM3746740.1 hypothetical protein [Paenibacillus pasadenensis]
MDGIMQLLKQKAEKTLKTKAPMSYSNYGFGLLGLLLTRVAGAAAAAAA